MRWRVIEGMQLVAKSPSEYYWAKSRKLQFKFDGAMWWLILPGRARKFVSLKEACAFAYQHMAETPPAA